MKLALLMLVLCYYVMAVQAKVSKVNHHHKVTPHVKAIDPVAFVKKHSVEHKQKAKAHLRHPKPTHKPKKHHP